MRYPHCILKTLGTKGTQCLQMRALSQASSLRDGQSFHSPFKQRVHNSMAALWYPLMPAEVRASLLHGLGLLPHGDLLPICTLPRSAAMWGQGWPGELGFINPKFSPGLEKHCKLNPRPWCDRIRHPKAQTASFLCLEDSQLCRHKGI
jgi:hypothetical protein